MQKRPRCDIDPEERETRRKFRPTTASGAIDGGVQGHSRPPILRSVLDFCLLLFRGFSRRFYCQCCVTIGGPPGRFSERFSATASLQKTGNGIVHGASRD